MVMLEVKELALREAGCRVAGAPANCSAQAQGEWTAEGMHIHFETTSMRNGSGQVDLKTGKNHRRRYREIRRRRQ